MITLLFLACAKHEPDQSAMAKPEPAPAPAPTVVESAPPEPAQSAPEEASAIASLEATNGTKISGAVAFTQSDGDVKVSVNLLNATPGEYTLRLRKDGGCAMDGASEGADDFGKVLVDGSGEGHVDLTLSAYKVAEGDDAIIGRAVVVGDGLACGVVAAR